MLASHSLLGAPKQKPCTLALWLQLHTHLALAGTRCYCYYHYYSYHRVAIIIIIIIMAAGECNRGDASHLLLITAGAPNSACALCPFQPPANLRNRPEPCRPLLPPCKAPTHTCDVKQWVPHCICLYVMLFRSLTLSMISVTGRLCVWHSAFRPWVVSPGSQCHVQDCSACLLCCTVVSM